MHLWAKKERDAEKLHLINLQQPHLLLWRLAGGQQRSMTPNVRQDTPSLNSDLTG